MFNRSNSGSGVAAVLVLFLVSCGQDRSITPTIPAPASAPETELPEPRECTTEREDALAYKTNSRGADKGPILVKEWDGNTPFLFYFNQAGLPESEVADAERILDVAERLSDHIEEQIGYSIFEVAGWMDEEIEFPFRVQDECDWREPGQIVAMIVTDTEHRFAAARPYCAIWASFGPHIDIDHDGTVAHETFHNFGFGHHPSDVRPALPEDRGVHMSVRLTGNYLSSDDLGVTFEDVDALRCIFPQ